MITIREAFDKKVRVKFGGRVVDTVVGMPGDMYQLFFFSNKALTVGGYETVTEISENDYLAAAGLQEQLDIAHVILEQMGGQGKLKAMVNGRDWVTLESGVQFSFSGKRGMNKCRVIYNRGPDTYTFELWYINAKKGTCTLKFQLEGVYFDMLIPLFEEQTGLYLSL